MIDVLRIKELLRTVPQPPEDSLPRGLGDDDLAGFEKRTGISLPSDFREWLRITNGPCVGPGGIYGIYPTRKFLDIENFLKRFPVWLAKKWIPVAGDGCGNNYVIATEHEYGEGFPVLFIETSTNCESPAFIVASDFGHFVLFLLEKEVGRTGWPFNETTVVQVDPKICGFHGVALPWTATCE